MPIRVFQRNLSGLGANRVGGIGRDQPPKDTNDTLSVPISPHISQGSSQPSSTSITPKNSRVDAVPVSQSVAESTKVLSRLHALFNTAPVALNQGTSGHGDMGADAAARVKNELPHLSDDTLDRHGTAGKKVEVEFEDRNAIKVLIVTWNMGDSLVSRISRPAPAH